MGTRYTLSFDLRMTSRARWAMPSRRTPNAKPKSISGLPADALRRFRSAAGHFERDEADRLVVVALRIRMATDHWLGRFSAGHPELRIEALHWASLDERTSVLDYWIDGHPAGAWVREIAANPDVQRVDPLAEAGTGALYRIVQRMNPVVELYRRLQLPLRFPMTVQAGDIAWEIVARKSEFDEVMAFFEKRGLKVTISSVRRGLTEPRLPLLTPTQRGLLVEAMRAGYFAVPRGISLTALAKRVGRSKSSVSESLSHIERKLLEASLPRAGGLPGSYGETSH